MHQRSAGAHHFSGTRRLWEPSDGEQSVQSSAYNKLSFPSMWATRQNITEIKKQIDALIVLKLQVYIRIRRLSNDESYGWGVKKELV